MSKMFWDIRKPLSYNALFNFIVGARGVGKTYGAKEYCLDNYFKNGSQFVYVRRFKEEFRRINNFFDDIQKYPTGLSAFKGEFRTDEGDVVGYYMPLTTAKINKSAPMPNVTDIIFDEFIIDKGFTHYIPDEVTNFLELYSTIARLREVRVWFLSNALTVTNPYFIYFDIALPYGKEISVKNDILIQMVKSEEYSEVAKETRFGKIIAGTPYGDYNLDNKFLLDNRTFVKKKGKDSKYYFSFIWQGDKYGVWIDSKAAAMYVSRDVDPTFDICYTFMTDDQQPNTVLLKGIQPYCVKNFFNVYKLGGVYFESVQIKNVCRDIIKIAL